MGYDPFGFVQRRRGNRWMHYHLFALQVRHPRRGRGRRWRKRMRQWACVGTGTRHHLPLRWAFIRKRRRESERRTSSWTWHLGMIHFPAPSHFSPITSTPSLLPLLTLFNPGLWSAPFPMVTRSAYLSNSLALTFSDVLPDCPSLRSAVQSLWHVETWSLWCWVLAENNCGVGWGPCSALLTLNTWHHNSSTPYNVFFFRITSHDGLVLPPKLYRVEVHSFCSNAKHSQTDSISYLVHTYISGEQCGIEKEN